MAQPYEVKTRSINDDPAAYVVWREEVSQIAIRNYKDPFGQDPTNKAYGEDELMVFYESGKTAQQVWGP